MDNNTDLSNVQQYNNETKKMVSSNLSTELLLTRSLVADWKIRELVHLPKCLMQN